jgi:hypothetical protein
MEGEYRVGFMLDEARSQVAVPRGDCDGVIAPRRKRFLSIRRLILQTRRSAPMPSVPDRGIKPCLVSDHSRITPVDIGYRGVDEGRSITLGLFLRERRNAG